MCRSALFLFAAIALAQNDTVFRTTTQLVRIDVAAQDKEGHVVSDLTKDDFELKVSGKPQLIDTFTVTSDTPAPSVTLPRGTFSNKQAAVEVSQGRYTVFLLDWRNTNWQLQAFANQQLLKMMSETPPGGKVAFYVLTDSGFQIMQEFTSDHELVRGKAAGLWGQVPAPAGTVAMKEAAAHETVRDFQDIAKYLSGISGQKVLIWISTGFPGSAEDIDNVVRVLGNANIVVESTDAAYLGAITRPEFGPVKRFPDVLQDIAERTGGRYFAGSNDLAAELLAAANDRSTSYELGYYAGDNLQPGLQPFEIRCKRPGVTLRYREGYYIDKKPPVVQSDTRAAGQDILEGAVDAVGIPLTASATRTAGNVGSIVLRLNIDVHALTFRQDGALWRTKISSLARFASDLEDQVGDIPLDSPALNLTQAQHDRAVRDGINLRFTMRIPKGASTLRVLVRDEDSGNAGTVTIPVTDLPEFQ
jgi:VWFA-related protein